MIKNSPKNYSTKMAATFAKNVQYTNEKGEILRVDLQDGLVVVRIADKEFQLSKELWIDLRKSLDTHFEIISEEETPQRHSMDEDLQQIILYSKQQNSSSGNAGIDPFADFFE